MKATHIKWLDMWDKCFRDYPGLVTVLKGKHSGSKDNESNNDLEEMEKCKPYFFLSESEDISPCNNQPAITNKAGNCRPPDNGTYSEYFCEEANCYIIKDQKEFSETAEAKEVCNNNLCHENTVESRNMEDSHETVNVQAETPKSRTIARSRSLGTMPGDIIFECEAGQGFAFTVNNEEALTFTPNKTCFPKTLGIIAIDTTCLKKPRIKVLFSCNIHFTPRIGEATAQLEFILSRSCSSGGENPIGNWVYDTIERNERISHSFKFNFCSCNSFPGCYNYFVRVIPVYIKNCSVCITGCHMDAFAQSR